MNFIAVCSLGFATFLSSPPPPAGRPARFRLTEEKLPRQRRRRHPARFIEVNLVSSASSLPLLSFPFLLSCPLSLPSSSLGVFENENPRFPRNLATLVRRTAEPFFHSRVSLLNHGHGPRDASTRRNCRIVSSIAVSAKSSRSFRLTRIPLGFYALLYARNHFGTI